MSQRDFPGTQRFRVLRKLGQGGMGAVYEVEDGERNERVALKTLLRADGQALQRFKQEFRALQDLSHPNLVRLGELFESEGDWFFTMELIAGAELLPYVAGREQPVLTLDQTAELRKDGAPHHFDERRLRASFQQLALALHALHAGGKIHRDVKPSNVRVLPGGRTVLLDFGLVKDVGAAPLSSGDHVVGTVAYMAPEQAASGPVGPAADWYAFGVVLYEALTGALPISGGPLAVLMEKQRITPAPPRARVPDVPRDLDELCAELLHFAPHERPRGEEVLRRLGVSTTVTPRPAVITHSSRSESLFVGRARELAELRIAYDEMTAGRTSTVTLRGPSGVGKSAIVAQFLDRFEEDGERRLFLRGRCYEREAVRFKALDGVIDALASALCALPVGDRRELAPRHSALLLQVFPVLGRVDVLSRAPRSSLRPRDHTEERRWVFGALRELLTRVGERWPLVLVVDDIHWADPDSLELLRALLEPQHDPPPRLLLILTTREETGSRWPWTSGSWPSPLRIFDVSALSAADATLLAGKLLSRQGVGEDAAEVIAAEAGGHPLFVAELVRHLGAPEPGDRSHVSLDEAIWARSAQLPAMTRKILALLAVASVPLPASIVELAVHLDPGELERHLAVLRVGAFVRATVERGQRRVETYHDRIREAVLARLGEEEKLELHATLAPLLAEDPSMNAELVAQHYLAAGDRSKAAELFERAALRAEEGFAFERAATLHRRQLQLRTLDAAARSQVYRRVGAALARAGQAFDAAAAYGDALEGASPSERLELRHLAATYLLRSGHVNEGLAELEAVAENAGLHVPDSTAGVVAMYLLERARLRLTGYKTRFQPASEIAPAKLARADAAFTIAQGLSLVDGVRAAPQALRALRVALDAGERMRVIKTLAAEMVLVSLTGRKAERRVEVVRRALRDAVAPLADPLAQAYLHSAEAQAAISVCRFQDAHDEAGEALRLLDTPGIDAQWERAFARSTRFFSMLYLARFRELVVEADEALRDAEFRRDRWMTTILQLNVTPYMMLRAGASGADIHAMAERGFEPWRGRRPGFLYFNYWNVKILVDLGENDWKSALARLADTARAVEDSASPRVELLRSWMLIRSTVTYLQAYAGGAGDDMLRRCAADSRQLARIDTPFAQGLHQLVEAQLAWAHRLDDKARELARTSDETFLHCGMRGQAAIARILRGRFVGGADGDRLAEDGRNLLRGETLPVTDVMVRSTAPYACEPPAR